MDTKSWRNRIVTALAVVGTLGCAFIAFMFLHEFVVIGVIADPEILAGHHFGSEGMRFHGGWRDETASVYAWSALFEGLLLFVVAGLLAWSAKRRSIRGTAIGYAAAAIWCAGIWLRVF